MSTNIESRQLFTELKPGDELAVEHEVKIGSSKSWTTRTIGKVVRTERRRQGLAYRRNIDDKVFTDMIVLERNDGEQTTITMDEFTTLKRLD